MDVKPLIHVAGNPVHFGTRAIQRCAICGVKLLDHRVDKVVYKNGVPYTPATWSVGLFLEEVGEGKFKPRTALFEHNETCWMLVEEAADANK